ncbi:hypothetical protein D9M72_576090 [compost metagenome]
MVQQGATRIAKVDGCPVLDGVLVLRQTLRTCFDGRRVDETRGDEQFLFRGALGQCIGIAENGDCIARLDVGRVTDDERLGIFRQRRGEVNYGEVRTGI